MWEAGRAASSGHQKGQTEYSSGEEWPVCLEMALVALLLEAFISPYREGFRVCLLRLTSYPNTNKARAPVSALSSF